jgi:hypothetical protein
VIAAALFALVNGVVFHIPSDHQEWRVVVAIVFIVSFSLHVMWLTRLYHDCRGIMEGLLGLSASRVRILTLFTAPIYLVWAPFALRLLFRCARIRATERGCTVAASLARCEDTALALQRGGLLSLVVSIIVALRLRNAYEPYWATGSLPETLDFEILLGPTMLWTVTLFNIVLGGAYVWYVATSIPLLYRNLPKLMESPRA